MSAPNSPSIKKLEKKFAKEAKHEDKVVKQALRDVQVAEKDKAHAQKAAIKADQTVEKIAKIEVACLKSLNKLTHQHDAVLADLHDAERDADLKRQAGARLTAELETKKARAAEALQNQLAETEKRKSTLLELRQGPGTTTPESRLSDASA